MASLNANVLTLADWAKRLDPNGNVSAVAELLTQTNEILDDMVFQEGNLPTGHRVTIRTGLPTVYWRSLNKGVPVSKSQTAQVDESCGMLEAYSRVDKDLAALNGNTAAFRLSEDRAFLEAMDQEQAQTLIYGNPAHDPRQFLGLAARYSTIGGAANGANVLDAGGTGTANCSVWLVCWGEGSVFGTFPKGSKAGLHQKDLGESTVYDEHGNPYQALQTHYQWKNGLVVRDWRYVVRIANIDTATFAGLSGTQAPTAVATNLIHLMARALDRIPNFGNVRPVFYMNRSAYGLLRRLALEKSVNTLSIEKGLDQFGTPRNWTSFEGVPLRKVDALINTEARVA
jgi:hypothetical protein|nr:MAG TPA: major capsid protein [Caudoviricetes sp.]